MGRDRYIIHQTEYPYFVTCNIINGLPLFAYPHLTQIILEALVYLQQENKAILTAYVIMENHLHMIVQSDQAPSVLGSLKSYAARSIIESIKFHHQFHWLKLLQLSKRKYKRDQQYQVWESGLHPKQLMSDQSLIQKMEYIHQNPVRQGYGDRPEDWRYSSARNYLGLENLIPVTLFGY